MKPAFPRTASLVSLFLLAALFAAPAAHAQIGIAGGPNFDRIGDIGDDDATDLNFDNATGYHIGVFYDFAFGPVGVRPGVYYMDVGSFDVDVPSNLDPDFSDALDLNLIEVPIDLRYRFITPILKPYVTAGPVVRFNVSDNEGFDEATNDFTVAGNAGLGTDVSLPTASLGLFVELRYSFGITPIADQFDAIDADDDETRLNNFMLRAGVKF